MITKIIVDDNICNPNNCDYECLSVCPVNRRSNSMLAIFISKNQKTQINDKECVHCKRCVNTCPQSAINVFEDNSKDDKLNYIPPVSNKEINIGLWKHQPYIIDRDIFKPFSEKDTIFARVVSDPTYVEYQNNPYVHMQDIINKNKTGYSREDFALTLSSWTVYDHFKGAFSREPLYKKSEEKFEEDPKKLTRIIKQVARANGAALVGIAKLNRDWIYSHDREGKPNNIPEHMNNVVVMAIEMDYSAIQTSPAQPSGFATGNAYSRMAFAQATVAEFIRQLGYDAIPAGNGVARSVPLAIDAGLGEFGRHGLLITEKYGSRVRICKVFTDMPLNHDKPVKFGVQKFCRVCKKCANLCPSQSISHADNPTWTGKTKSNNHGILKWYVNVETCYSFWVNNGGDCSNCITSCPFTKSTHWSHKIVRFFIKHFPIFNKIWVKLDDIFGYGKQKDPKEFWSDRHEFIHLKPPY